MHTILDTQHANTHAFRYHTVEDAIREEALSKFFPPTVSLRVEPTTGGVSFQDRAGGKI